MGSRLRERPERLFEVFVEIAKPDVEGEEPFIIQQYPPEFDDKEALAMIPKFAYPCPAEAAQVDHFTFVLTDLDSMFRFGYCRHSTGHQTCLCILSWLPWCEVFYKMLDLLAEMTNRPDNSAVTDFMQATYEHEVPLPKVPVTIVAKEDMFSFTAPDPSVLPSIPSSRHLTEYYNAVDANNMMLIFASMLHERRIYMTSKKLSRLTSCIHAAEALLYPMHWQHLYIPVLPAHLIDYISAPMPYLIGVHSNLIQKLQVNRVDIGDAVCVDLDTNTITTEYDDLNDLPEDVSSYLKRNLKMDVIKNSMDAISKAFLQALVRLIGGYRDALKFRPGEPITFDPEAFIQSRTSPSTQAFLEGMLTLQIFQQFIYGRLEILNGGEGFTDIFERQATQYADKLNSQSRYKEWVKSVAKSKRRGKEVWNGFKVKVFHSIRQKPKMKVQGKKAMAKLSMTDNDDKEFRVSGGKVHSKTSVSLRSSRPPRPPPPSDKNKSLSRPESMTKPAFQKSAHEDSQDDSQLRLSYHTMDMSLMADEDIQAALMRSASAEIIPNQEGSSDSSSSVSSESLEEETDSANIPFGNLHSSEEDLSFGGSVGDVGPSPGDVSGVAVVTKKDTQGSNTDKLILARPKLATTTDSNELGPVPPPRAKRSSPRVSPAASPKLPPAQSAATKAADPNAPKALPRPSSVKSPQSAATQGQQSFTTVQDAPLIRFESSESDATDSDIFDPLASLKSPSSTDSKNVEIVDDSEVVMRPLERNRGSRGSLSRTKAFRHESTGVPKRPGYKEEDSPDREIEKGKDVFDPLADLADLSLTPPIPPKSSGVPTHSKSIDPLANHSPRRKESKDLLMHEWSLASLAKGPSITLPPGLSQSGTGFPRPVGMGHMSMSGFNSLQHGRNAFPQTTRPSSAFSSQVGFGPARSQSPTPTPAKLRPQSYAPFGPTAPQSPLIHGNNVAPVKKHPPVQTPSPFIHGSFHPVQRPQSGTSPTLSRKSTNLPPPSTAKPSTAPSAGTNTSMSGKQSDLFSDLLDINFSGGPAISSASPQQSNSQQASTTSMQQAGVATNQSAPPPRPPQPKWETFD